MISKSKKAVESKLQELEKNSHSFSLFLSDNDIAKRYGVSRQTVWRWAATDQNFPKPIKLTPGCTRWKLSDIEAWEGGKEAA